MSKVSSDFSKLLRFFVVLVAVKLILLEETCIVVYLVFFFAVDVFEGIVARYSLWSLQSWWADLKVGFTTLHHVTVMLKFIRAIILRAFGSVNMASKSCVFPSLAIVLISNSKFKIRKINKNENKK